jgi:hypothetical protein
MQAKRLAAVPGAVLGLCMLAGSCLAASANAEPEVPANLTQLFTINGTCESLKADKEDLSALCGSSLLQTHYENSRVGLYVLTSKKVITFSGLLDASTDEQTRYDLDQVLVSTSADDIQTVSITGTCTYGDMTSGKAVRIECTGHSEDGASYTLAFKTDGQPPEDAASQ